MTFTMPWGLRLRRHTLKFTFRQLFRLLFKVKIYGMENVPKDGPYIIAYNHISLFEPPYILAFWPALAEPAIGHDVWTRPGAGLLVHGYSGIPVRRGEYDRETLRRMVAVLRAGYPLMIAPEGGRSHHSGMRQAKAGVAYLVDLSGAPVLPVAVVGTSDDSLRDALRGRRPVLEMRIGNAFTLPPIAGQGAERRAVRQRNADQVMKRIGVMLPEKYHGVYAGQIETSAIQE